MSAQKIELLDKPYILIPEEEYEKLIEHIEDLEDIEAVRKSIESNEEALPYDIVKQIIDGESPVKVYREYRGLTQKQLAEKVDVSEPYISMIEAGERTGTKSILKKIALALSVDVDDII